MKILFITIWGLVFSLKTEKKGIEEILLKNFYAEKKEDTYIMKGRIEKNIEEYIILEDCDKIVKKIWKELLFEIKIKLKEKRESTILEIDSYIKVLGYPEKIFIPPVYEERKSNGKLEREIFEAIKNEKYIEKLKKEIEFYEIKNSPPFEPNIDLITPPDGKPQNELTCVIKGAKIAAGWNDYRGNTNVTVGMSYSVDSGKTWSNNQLPANGLWYPEQGDPVLAWGKGDTLYFAFITFNRQTWTGDIGLLISPNGGTTWTNSINVTNDSYFDDKPWISAYNDTILLTYAGGPGFDVYFMKSTNGGASFSSPVLINTSGNGSMPKKGPNGEIYVMWGLDYPQNSQYDEGIWIRKSTDGGNTFLPKVHVADLYVNDNLLPWRCYPIPSMDIDMNTGYIYIVYQSTDPGRTNWDIYFTKSTNGGASFSTPVRVNDITQGHQFFPWISCDENGKIHVIWYDTRTGGYNLDVYYAYSEDYGASFSQSMKVNDYTKPPVWQTFIGDYNAIDVKNGVAGVAWCHPAPDNSTDDAWFARMVLIKIKEKNFSSHFKNSDEISVFDLTGRKVNLYNKTGIYFLNLKGKNKKILKLKGGKYGDN
ncbi:MAG: hypothetical protein ABIM77_04670 [candidate division WOR-3 bacterium]